MDENLKIKIAYKLELFSLITYLVGSVLFVAGAIAALIVQQLRI